MDDRSEIDLSAGVIEYRDTGGDGEPIVLVHGLAMDETVWDGVVDRLCGEFRVLAPTTPTGGHRRPMRDGADLSPVGQALLLGEFLERLGLHGATVVQNDIGTAQLMVGRCDERIGRLVLCSCEALENYPPGGQGRLLDLLVRLPGGLGTDVLAALFRPRPLRRLPISLAGMARRPIPSEVSDRWLRPLLTDRAIRRDLGALLAAAPRGLYLEAAERLRTFDRPALVVWGADDRMMPPATGRRLANLLPQGRFRSVPDARTLVPFDDPAALAAELRAFVRATPLPGAGG